MKVRFLLYAYTLLVIFLVVSACKNEKANPIPEIEAIDLLRGDILLCGGEEFGQVSFEFTCKNSMRATFNLAISLLHSFEYEEAEKAFVKVIDGDPNCAMAYWGVAMSIYHALWKAPTERELEKGLSLILMAESRAQSRRERDYISAVGAFYKDWKTTSHETRASRLEKAMEKVYKAYPQDKEAAIFYALALNSTADPTDKTYENRKKAGSILENIFPDQPNHPGIAHYIIHNYDNPKLADQALTTARKYATIAPSSAHAQHMPSHIFTRLGLWDESIQSNLNSAEAARCYAEQRGMEGNWTSELHALDYLMYAYLQKGDTKRAYKLYDYIEQIQKVTGNNASISYPFAAIPARMVLENKDWVKAANLPYHQVEMQWESFPWERSIYHFTRAIGASHIGNISLAEKELKTLKLMHENLEAQDEQYKADQVMVQIHAARAWLEYAKGNHELAIKHMMESVDLEDSTEKHPVTPGELIPAGELLGDLMIQLSRPDEALVAYEKSLSLSPSRFNGLYGAANAANRIGDSKKAAFYFGELLKLSEGTSSDRSEIQEAKSFLNQI